MLRQLLDIARGRKARGARLATQGQEGPSPVPSRSASDATAPPEADLPAFTPEPVQPALGGCPVSLPFMIRPAGTEDLQALADIFRRSVHELARRDYDTAQLTAWAARADEEGFLSGLAQGTTILAENHGEPVAFAQLAPADHVRMLYVRPDWAGLGIATLLCQYLEDEARIAGSRELTTAASHTARRFFESMGYKAEAEESVQLGSVTLDRSLMRKKLHA